MKKVCIIEPNIEYIEMFQRRGWAVLVKEDIEQADLIQFTGGADVSPLLYHHGKHPQTHTNPDRDVREQAIFNRYVGRKKFAGICRGGQFLNVMNGGTMHQHVGQHTTPHNVVDRKTGKLVWCSSTHHQMMQPDEDATIVATANECDWYEKPGRGRFDQPAGEDIEVLYYAVTDSLCFQPHPEFRDPKMWMCRDYYFGLIDELLEL